MFDGTKKLQYGNLTAMEAKSVESWARHQHYTLEGIESAMSPPIMIICTRHDSISKKFEISKINIMGSFHVKSPNALNGSDPDFDENAYIWSL